MKCMFCKTNKFKINKLLKHHQTCCKLNPNRRSGGNQFTIAKKNGIILHHSEKTKKRIGKVWKGKHHTKESKEKLSKAAIKYLENNPDKVPYLLNHSSKQSYPEKIFEKALIKNNISQWTQKYRIYIYEYDFAFIDLKIDVEIDGSTHNSEKVKKIDKRRDKWSKKNGWRVLRFKAKDVQKDVQKCINKLLKYL